MHLLACRLPLIQLPRPRPHHPSHPPCLCSDTRTRFLGTKPPKLFAAPVRGERSMLALSSRPWCAPWLMLCLGG